MPDAEGAAATEASAAPAAAADEADEAAGTTSPRSSPPSAQKRENRLAVNSLMLASAARNFAITVRQQSEQEIWLLAYQGDFGAQARAQGLLESVAGTRSGTARSVIMCTPQLTAHAAV